MLEYIIFAVTVILCLIITIVFLAPGSKKITTIPGPDILDELEGNFPDIRASGSLHEFLVELHEIYGPITAFWYGPKFCVSIASPELLKEQANVFDRPQVLFELFEDVISPHSIQYANGGEGRKRHSAYTKCFSHDAIRGYFAYFTKFSKEMKEKFEGLAKEEHVPLGQHMFSFSIKSVLASSFGSYFHNDKEILDFKRAYDYLWGEMENRLATGQTDPDTDKFDKYKKLMLTMLEKSAEMAKKNPRDDGEKQLVDYVDELNVSQEVMTADMLTIVIGGVHTTGLLLTWAIYFMATHKDVQEKVYKELKDVLGDDDIVLEAVPKLTYMRQVLDETLRCATLAPMAARVQNIDTELGGHKIPSGTPVVHALGVVLSDSSLWPEPDKFDPERFSEENRRKIPSCGFEPFGFAGKRKCPGYKFSYTESTVLLSELIRNFKFDLIEGQVVQKVYGLVTKPMDEIWITIEKRK